MEACQVWVLTVPRPVEVGCVATQVFSEAELERL